MLLGEDDGNGQLRIDSFLDLTLFVFLQPFNWMGTLNLPSLWEKVQLYLYLQPWWMHAFCTKPEHSSDYPTILCVFLVTFQGKCLQPGCLCFPLQWSSFKVLGRTSSYGNPFNSHLARDKPTLHWTASWDLMKWRGKHKGKTHSSWRGEMGAK